MKKLNIALALMMVGATLSAEAANTVFFKSLKVDGSSWGTVAAYCWNSSSDLMETPDIVCKGLGNNMWVASYPSSFSNIIFTSYPNAWGYEQSPDFTGVADLSGYYSGRKSDADNAAGEFDNFSASLYGNFAGSDKAAVALTYVESTTYKTPTFTYSEVVDYQLRLSNGDEILTTAKPSANLTMSTTSSTLSACDADAYAAIILPVNSTYHLEIDFATLETRLVVESLPSESDITIYYDNSQTQWGSVKIYYWAYRSTAILAWTDSPSMTLVDPVRNIWSYTFKGEDYPSIIGGIIFRTPSGNMQTADYNSVIAGHLYSAPAVNNNRPAVTDEGVYVPVVEDPITIYYDNSRSHWSTVYVHYWDANGNNITSWPGDAMTCTDEARDIWSYTFSSDMYPSRVAGFMFDGSTQSNAYDGKPIDGELYKCISNKTDVIDLGQKSAYDGPDEIYVTGTFLGAASWGSTPGTGVKMVKNGPVYTAKSVIVAAENGVTDANGFVNLVTTVTSSWGTMDSSGTRFGPLGSEDTQVDDDGTSSVRVHRSNCRCWIVTPGVYDITFDWSTMKISFVSVAPEDEQDITIYYDNTLTKWPAVNVHYWDANFDITSWPGAALTQCDAVHDIWSITFDKSQYPSLIKGFMFVNGNDGSCQSLSVDQTPIDGEIYKCNANKSDTNSLGQLDDYTGPDDIILMGTLAGDGTWIAGTTVKMAKNGSIYTAEGVEVVANPDTNYNTAYGYFNLTTYVGSTWSDTEQYATRIGAIDADTIVDEDNPASATVNRSGAKSWMVTPGIWDITFDWKNMTLSVVNKTPDDPDITIYYDNSKTQWSTVNVHYWGGMTSTWPGNVMTVYDASDNIWTFTFSGKGHPSTITGFLFDGGSSGIQSADFDDAPIDGHLYYCLANKNPIEDLGEYAERTPIDTITADEFANLDAPALVEITDPFRIANAKFDTSTVVITMSGIELSGLASTSHWVKYEDLSSYTARQWYLSDNPYADYEAYFEASGKEGWKTWNGKWYGDPTDRTWAIDLASGSSFRCRNFSLAYYRYYLCADSRPAAAAGVSAKSISVPSGTSRVAFTIAVDENTTGVDDILSDVDIDNEATAVYYNLQGIRVDNPAGGVYIRVAGKDATKVIKK
jgi:hypothetical protein